jgi:hypothetical protein
LKSEFTPNEKGVSVMAYHSQGISLVRVQRDAKEFERLIKQLTNGRSGRIKYGDYAQMKLQVDVVLPNAANPKTLISVTHSNPDIPGHSNENKFQLKLGELYLCKTYNPNYRCILISGGTQEAWLSYVLTAFDFFFDKVVYLWDDDFEAKLDSALSCPIKNIGFWIEEQKYRSQNRLSNSIEDAPFSEIRGKFYDTIIPQYLNVTHPSEINHLLLKVMANLAFEKYNQTNGRLGRFWEYLPMPLTLVRECKFVN